VIAYHVLLSEPADCEAEYRVLSTLCLRSDRNIHLVSYSYYAKYVTSDDLTYFRHIDMNIDQYLANDHERNIIQEFLSLDNESIERRIEIILSFHENIKE